MYTLKFILHASIILRLFYVATLENILIVIKRNDFATAHYAHKVLIKSTAIRKYSANKRFRAKRDRNNASQSNVI